MGFKLWEDLLLGRLVPSISGTITAFILIYLVIWLFRIRNPGTRYLLYHLPLLKGLIILIRGVPAPLPAFRDRPRFGLQIFDPFSMLRVPDLSIEIKPSIIDPIMDVQTLTVYPLYDLVQVAFFMALGAALGIFAYRWIGLSLYYHRLLRRPEATRSEAPALFAILDRLVSTFGVGKPRIILIDELAISPCTIGLNPPTIVLPKKLISELGESQLEAVLAHELAHVSRKDGIFHWPSLMLRDLQIYNPLAHRLFDRLIVERELDADLRAAAATGQPRAMAKALVDVALLSKGVSLRPAPGAMSFREGLIGSTSIVERRMQALLAGPVAVSRLRSLGMLLLLTYLLLIRIYIQFPLLGHTIILE